MKKSAANWPSIVQSSLNSRPVRDSPVLYSSKSKGPLVGAKSGGVKAAASDDPSTIIATPLYRSRLLLRGVTVTVLIILFWPNIRLLLIYRLSPAFPLITFGQIVPLKVNFEANILGHRREKTIFCSRFKFL